MTTHEHNHEEHDELFSLPEPQHLSPATRIVPYSLLKDFITESGSRPTHLIISLDGRPKSPLDWTRSLEMAKEAAFEGYGIVFDLDLGFNEEAGEAAFKSSRVQSMKLACAHFRQAVVPHFNTELLGVLLFKGSMPIENRAALLDLNAFDGWCSGRGLAPAAADEWDRRRFCHETAIEELRIASFEIPDHLHRFVLLSPENGQGAASTLLHTAKDLLSPLHAVICSQDPALSPYIFDCSQCNGSDGSFLGARFYTKGPFLEAPGETAAQSALLLPRYSSITHHTANRFEDLTQKLSQNPSLERYLLVHEPFFATEWQGLDRVVVSGEDLSSDGMRTLRGFAAAGGVVDINSTRTSE